MALLCKYEMQYIGSAIRKRLSSGSMKKEISGTGRIGESLVWSWGWSDSTGRKSYPIPFFDMPVQDVLHLFGDGT